MNNFLNLLINVTIFVTFAVAIYVPETTIKENKPLTPEDYTNVLKLNNNYDVNGQKAQQQSLFNALKAKSIKTQYQLLSPIPTLQKSYDIDDDVDVNAKKRTNNHNTQHYQENLEAQPTGLQVAAEHKQQQQHLLANNDVLNNENEILNEFEDTLPHSRQKRQLTDFLIAPNTRWCGRGNTANGTYNHLGGASMADKCCRTHDHCKLYIPGMSNRFEMFNYRPYTLSHCNCDRRFRTCLKMANDEDAKTIGKLFFNLVQTQCFVLSKEVVCRQRADDGTCLKEYVKQKAYLRNNKKF